MKFLIFFSLIYLFFTRLQSQNYPPFIKNDHLTKVQFDSIYQSIMHRQYADYQNWQKALPQLQKQKIKKSTIKGLIWGGVLGSIVGAATNDLLAPNPLRPLNGKRTLLGLTIGGIMGGNVGRFIGWRRAKNIKFYFDKK